MDNIILIGMPGTGKSTVGVVLAKLLGYDFIDTDIVISNKEKRPLSQIIAEDGYNRFIEIEGEVGAELKCSRCVIATGGSMVFSENAMNNLKSLGTLVWLDTPLEVLEERLSKNMMERGVGTPRKMTVKEIFEVREPLYCRWSELRLPCRGDAEQVVEDLRKMLFGYQKA